MSRRLAMTWMQWMASSVLYVTECPSRAPRRVAGSAFKPVEPASGFLRAICRFQMDVSWVYPQRLKNITWALNVYVCVCR